MTSETRAGRMSGAPDGALGEGFPQLDQRGRLASNHDLWDRSDNRLASNHDL